MINRRVLLETGPGALLGAFLAQINLAPSEAQAAEGGPILVQDLPPVSLDGWTVTATEVDYQPGGVNKPHRHPGFVLGYVLEGEVRFQLKGGTERTCRTG
jgi:quercetin dioxygenase-like cupin family protein